jgi:hypothetical protein
MISLEPEATQAIWSSLHKRIIRAVENVWKCVRSVLCNDAPEGHVPDDVEEDVNLTTKDVLSYSWRALKEARYTTPVGRTVEYLHLTIVVRSSGSLSQKHQLATTSTRPRSRKKTWRLFVAFASPNWLSFGTVVHSQTWHKLMLLVALEPTTRSIQTC